LPTFAGVSTLVLQTAFLGDVVLTTPLLSALATRGPVDVVVTPAAAPLLASHPAVRTVIPFDKRRGDAGLAGLRRLAGRLRRMGYAEVFLAQGSHRSAALVRLAGIPRRVGFQGSAGRWACTELVAYDRSRHHAARLLALAGIDAPAAPRPTLAPDASARAMADALLAMRRWPARPLIAVAPGSVWATKRWPHYPALAAALAGWAELVVLGAPDDGPLATAIHDAAPDAVLDATGRLPLPASAALLAACAALVTNDSLPLHLASAMGTPTVAIFGPTVPAFGFGPLAPASVVVEHPALPCRPCDAHGPRRCPLGHFRCMRELPAERIVAALAALGVAPPS
jgi:heptosyltransferase-2